MLSRDKIRFLLASQMIYFLMRFMNSQNLKDLYLIIETKTQNHECLEEVVDLSAHIKDLVDDLTFEGVPNKKKDSFLKSFQHFQKNTIQLTEHSKQTLWDSERLLEDLS